MASTGSKLANTNMARGFAFAVAPEDVEPGYTAPGAMSDRLHGGINDAGEAQQNSPDPFFNEDEGGALLPAEKPKAPPPTYTRRDTPRPQLGKAKP